MSKKENLKNIMALLDSGESVKITDADGRGVLYLGFNNYNRFDTRKKNIVIIWENYGRSANKRTLKNLKWILDTIFDSKKYLYKTI